MENNGDALEERVYFADLYDIYSPILSEKQREVCSKIVDDLSASEIAGEIGISRQGVHDLAKRTRTFLESAERTLGVRRMQRAIRDIASIIEKYRDSLPVDLVRECEGVLNDVRSIER